MIDANDDLPNTDPNDAEDATEANEESAASNETDGKVSDSDLDKASGGWGRYSY